MYIVCNLFSSKPGIYSMYIYIIYVCNFIALLNICTFVDIVREAINIHNHLRLHKN